MTSSAMGLILGVVGFLLTTRGNTCKQNAPTIFAHRFMHVYFHALTAVHKHLRNHCYFDTGKNPNTPNLSPMLG